jgi:TusA-related sulfurtransferase
MKTKRKIRNLTTGKVITVWQSTDHPNSSYGIPVWVDYKNRDYGQVNTPIGYDEDGTIQVLPCAFGYELLPE